MKGSKKLTTFRRKSKTKTECTRMPEILRLSGYLQLCFCPIIFFSGGILPSQHEMLRKQAGNTNEIELIRTFSYYFKNENF